MELKLLGSYPGIDPKDRFLLENFCRKFMVSVTLEWKDGQWWLHSDLEKERPITINVDEELRRHEEYFRRSSLQKELLARAIGVKGAYRPQVIDLSAGLLGDTLLFLSFGCRVTAVERHPVIAFLIKHALQNAQHPALQRLSFLNEESDTVLESVDACEVIYFDPMFEDPNEKSSPRKEMRIFRFLVGKDQDAQQVFKKALKLKPKRLVVKRPKQSVALLETSLQYVGKSTRYDVYLPQNHGFFE